MHLGLNLMSSILILVYLGAVLVVGLAYSSTKDRSTEDYFFGGKTTGPMAFGSSLVLSNILRYQIVLLPLAALPSLWVAAGASFLAVILSYRLNPQQSAKAGFSKWWGGRVFQWYVSGILLLFTVVIQIAGLLVLVNLILGDALNLDYSAAALLMIVCAGICAVVGGFSAVARVQVFQIIVFITGLIALVLLKAIPTPGNLVPSLVSPQNISFKSAILGLPIMSLWIWHYDRFTYQQILSSKDNGSSVRSLFIAGAIMLLLVMIALVAASPSPNVASPLGYQILLIVCFTALMASFAPTFTNVAELMSNEIYKGLKPHSSEHELVLVGRLTTAVVVGLTILMMPFARSFGSRCLDLFLTAQACLFPPITAAFVARFIVKSTLLMGAAAALVAGEVVGIARFISYVVVGDSMSSHPVIQSFLSIDHYLFAFCLFCFSLVIVVGTGLVISIRSRVSNRFR
jgi:Na+/proline symporter